MEKGSMREWEIEGYAKKEVQWQCKCISLTGRMLWNPQSFQCCISIFPWSKHVHIKAPTRWQQEKKHKCKSSRRYTVMESFIIHYITWRLDDWTYSYSISHRLTSKSILIYYILYNILHLVKSVYCKRTKRITDMKQKPYW